MHTFVGFGFGPIQSGLFLYEAFASDNFDRYVVAEVDQTLVDAVRAAGGEYRLNIARKERIDTVSVRSVELYNPRIPADREKLVAAIAQAHELATALPSVDFYDKGGETSVVSLLAEGLNRRGDSSAVLYAAENHNHAAEILTERLGSHLPRNVQILNTVIGKMSGVIADTETIARMKLVTLTAATARAVLVEEFNRILISKINLPGFRRGIEVFIEKPDLLPFEEAKLYGHNAIHALIGYLAHERELASMAEAAHHADILAVARAAFLDESGAALCKKYASLGDELFAPAGWRAYAEDLLDRMLRPNLNDLVVRIIRDPQRKLGWDDRIFGTMRLALSQGIEPVNLARGAAAAVRILVTPANRADLAKVLLGLWNKTDDAVAGKLIDLTWQAF